LIFVFELFFDGKVTANVVENI